MRTGRTTAAAADSEPAEVSKLVRARKGSRSPSASLSSVPSSNHSSDAEVSPRREFKSEVPQPRQAVVIDHQGSTRVLQKPDGTIVFEAADSDDGGSGASRGGRNGGGPCGPGASIKDALITSGVVMTAAASLAGLMAAQQHSSEAARGAYCLTTKQLATVVAHTVTGYLAGTATGLVVGPLLAVRSVAGVLVRPALLGLLLHAGAKTLGRWRCGVAGLLRKLQSTDSARVLEALRAIIAAAQRRSPRFAREFNKLKGMEALLQRLAAALPDCPMLHLIAQALAELCKDQECRDSLVAAGGVPRLVSLLQSANPAVSCHALAALSQLTDHSLAVEAIREAGGLNRLVELTATASAAHAAHSAAALAASSGTGGAAASTSAAATAVPASPSSGASFDRRAMLLPAVKLLQALSLDPASKAAIGAAGGVPILLDVIARSEPRSEPQSEAVGALHNSLRGCPENQRALASLPAASEVLRGALGGYGPCWHPAKGDLHALLNVLARLQGVQEAGGFVVVQSQVAAAAAKASNTTPSATAAGSGPSGAVAVKA